MVMDPRERSELVGRRLRRAREEVGLTQVEFARIFGLTDAAIVYWEMGRQRKLDMARLEAFAAALGKPLEWFLADNVPAPTRPPQVVYSELGQFMVHVPVFDTVDGGAVGYVPVDWPYEKASRMRAYRLPDLALPPEVKEGDIVIVDRARDPADGALVLYTAEKKPGLGYWPVMGAKIVGVVARTVRDFPHK